MASLTDEPGFSEGEAVVGAGFRRHGVALAVESLVFKKEDRILLVYGLLEQSLGITGCAGVADMEAGEMGEKALDVLAVAESAVDVSADRHADDHGAEKVPGRAPAHGRHLIAQLHHGGPDIVAELDFDDRLEAVKGEADGGSDDAGLRQG